MSEDRTSSPLRVALLCVGWPGRHEVGGAARYAWRFAELLKDKVELHVITSEGGDPLDGATMHYLQNDGGRFFHYYRFPFQVRKLLNHLEVDVLHAFGDDWAVGRGAFAWVRTFHGSSLSEARASRGLRRWNHYLLGALEHSVRRRCDLAIAVGPEGESEFGTDLLIPPVVPRQGTPAHTAPTPTPSVVFVGTFAGRKRGEFAAHAVAEVSRRLQMDIELRVVGPARDAANWPPGVQHHADPSDAEVQALISESWTLVAPSTYEGFGIPAFEAMSLGVPSISCPNPGSRYIAAQIDDEEMFAVVEDEHFAAVLQHRMEQGPLTHSERRERAMRAVDELAERAAPDELLGLYRAVVAKRKNRD